MGPYSAHIDRLKVQNGDHWQNLAWGCFYFPHKIAANFGAMAKAQGRAKLFQDPERIVKGKSLLSSFTFYKEYSTFTLCRLRS
jgi:hypothetical protein